MTLRLAGIVNDSITDGPGIRLAVFGQGCPHKCGGCHNPDALDPLGGYDCGAEEIAETAAANPLLDGVTFTGGEPFAQAVGFAWLGRRIKERVPGLTVITYTGYTWEELDSLPGARELIEISDFIVDGRYDAGLKSLDLMHKGSGNQRFIDVKKTLEQGNVVLWTNC